VTRPQRVRMDLVSLSRRRYPDTDPLIALMYFGSDRRAAGLGALDERKRQGRGDVRCYKCVDPLTGRVSWHRRIDAPPRDYLPAFDPLGFDLCNPRATITVTRTPARKDHKAVTLDPFLLMDQRGRTVAARYLREMRLQMTSQMVGSIDRAARLNSHRGNFPLYESTAD
jgi:hypothetical protein